MINDNIKEYREAYYLSNKDKMKAKCHEYYLANKEKLCEIRRAYYLANKEKLCEYFKAYYLVNKEQCKAYAKKYYQGNNEYIAKYNTKLNTLTVKDIKKKINRKKGKVKNKQTIIEANLANLLVKKEAFKQKLLEEQLTNNNLGIS